MWDYVFLISGFFLLILGADFFVTGASSIATRLKVSGLVIGLTVVAFGTSAPELFISATAAVRNNPAIALGNVLGSNIANILLIFGLAALMRRMTFNSNTTLRELPIAIMAAIALWVMANDVVFNQRQTSFISRTDGLLLLCMFCFFLYYIFTLSRKGLEASAEKTVILSWPRSFFLLTTGLAGLIIGGNLIVEGAVQIAMRWQVSQSLVGLTIVAIGTSLPELATTLAATYKKDTDIAIGNIIGSNIFNILLILGVSATIHPIPIDPNQQTDFIITVASGVILLGAVFFGKRHELERWHGALFLCLYVGYILLKVFTDHP